ncbi:DUF998 domain-containing protein [Mycobacterium sp. B14F4]|uniref:DUF998 domain-containing protein n=1 Tax=Mycobacterium sp. B14F4 TaxID=3153565 RepID=UPI00325E52A1
MATAPTRTANRTGLVIGAVTWLVAAVGYVVLELLTAVALPGYSYTEHYISSLGVPAWSPRAYLMNAAFFAQGALFVMGAVLVVRAVRVHWTGVVFVVLAVITAVGDFLVGIVHGGSPLWNDGYEWLHALGAILAIFGGNAAILAGTAVVRRAVVAPGYRLVGTLIGLAGFVIFAMLENYNHWAIDYAPIGIVERGCVYTVMLWQLITGVVLLRRPVAPTA